MNDQYQAFVRQYNLIAEMSSRQYAIAPMPTFNHTGAYNEHHFVSREPGVQLTMCQRDLNSLIDDAMLGRQVRQLHTRHPAVLEAWDQYRIMLALTARSEGSDIP